VLIGGDGDDWIGRSWSRPNLPGPGADRVLAGPGDDRVVVYEACELQPSEILDGGAGADTLVIPVPLEALRARGVLVFGFENVVVDSSKRYLSECYRAASRLLLMKVAVQGAAVRRDAPS
jgi:hypothetical protein